MGLPGTGRSGEAWRAPPDDRLAPPHLIGRGTSALRSCDLRPAEGPKGSAAAFGLLAALLDVRLHEVLGVRLEHLVDLVEQVVELALDLLAGLGLRGRVLDDLVGLRRGLLLLLLTFRSEEHTSELQSLMRT